MERSYSTVSSVICVGDITIICVLPIGTSSMMRQLVDGMVGQVTEEILWILFAISVPDVAEHRVIVWLKVGDWLARNNTNLLVETENFIAEQGLSLADIHWIEVEGKEIELDNFIMAANRTNYDDGYGTQEVHPSLRIYGRDWVMYRNEYDGAEWWKIIYLRRPSEKVTMQHLRWWRKNNFPNLLPFVNFEVGL